MIESVPLPDGFREITDLSLSKIPGGTAFDPLRSTLYVDVVCHHHQHMNVVIADNPVTYLHSKFGLLLNCGPNRFYG